MKCCYRPQARRAYLKSRFLSAVSFELEDIKAFVVVVYSLELEVPTTTTFASCLKKKKNPTPQGALRFYLPLIYAAFQIVLSRQV